MAKFLLTCPLNLEM